MKIVIAALLLLVCGQVHSQNFAWYNMTQFENDSIGQDLSGNIVNDQDNNLWINGARGLYKISSFGLVTIYNKENSPIKNGGFGLCVDTLNHIWIANNGTLLEFDGDSLWSVYNNSNSGHPGGKIIDMKIDSKGNIWCVFSMKGIGKFSNGQFTLYNTSNSQIPTNAVSRIAIDKDSNVWISTPMGGLIKFNQQNFTFYSTLTNGESIPPLISLHADKNGHIWGGSYSNGIFHYDKSTFKMEKPNNLPKVSINKITEDNTGRLWFISSESNIISYDGTNWGINVGNSESLAARFVGGYFDNNNVLWVTSNDKGLFQYTMENNMQVRKKIPTKRENTNNDDTEPEGKVLIYPNPSKGASTISYANFGPPVTITVFDINGKVVKSYDHLLENGNISLQFNQPGIFFVQIVSQNYSIVKKLIFFQ